MTRDDSTLWIYVQPDGRWAGHYIDAYDALDIAHDCASPEMVKAAVIDGLGVRPTRIEVESPDIGARPRHRHAQPLTMAYEHRMLAMADCHISAACALIQAQEDRLATLARDGHETARGYALLGVLRATLQTMVEHRQLIVEQIHRLNRRDQAQAVDP